MRRPLDRRDFLLMGSAAVAAQWGFAAPTAANAAITIPVIDHLSIKVLTDSSYDTPRASASKWVKIRRVGLSAAGDYRKTLHNEWGLALALESQARTETAHLLLDFGYTTDALINNLEIMGVDLAKVQGLILSHGHFDHYGGLIGLLQKYRSRLPAELTLYAGGEDNFCRRVIAGSAPGQFAEWACSTGANSLGPTCAWCRARSLRSLPARRSRPASSSESPSNASSQTRLWTTR